MPFYSFLMLVILNLRQTESRHYEVALLKVYVLVFSVSYVGASNERGVVL